ncbi:transcription factor MYB124-like [Ipomoea triloba]|uniref:transcription factor MYB124-like n=1 Tax=Ipomoea triloba TaxID=35885 RepID=UPI00125D2881|nr:transcription factor MYB124-like [Ipomoea triloba]XP_031122076.1 transcription factor MYB124-like [Ipomoea triloba]
MHQNMKKKAGSTNSSETTKPKERHIVSWSQEEDDILREQIRVHGTDNWTIIASKFKDKTTRQCRRRWFTYLNSDFKRGGWSPEEDMLLCEAQRIFGNRWTEIAKVVSGRTDNAVKNRFTTLCKKRAKNEALAKENSNSSINRRVIFPSWLNSSDSISESAVPLKKQRRSHIPDPSESFSNGEKLVSCDATNQMLRSPFAVIGQNLYSPGSNVSSHQNDEDTKDLHANGSSNKTEGTFLKKDDPKILALMQQAELLSSLALKVNSENTDQSLENACKVLEDFLNHTKDGDVTKCQIAEMEIQLENFKQSANELKNINECSQPSWRQPALSEESAGSSEYSTGSTLLAHGVGDNGEKSEAELCALHQDIESGLQSTHIDDEFAKGISGNNASASQVNTFPACDKDNPINETICEYSNEECCSPLQVTPMFRSLAAAIPSPKFSESERQFLLKTLGMESTSPNPTINPSHPPSCKRALLHSL